jgi:hypothetical protein
MNLQDNGVVSKSCVWTQQEEKVGIVGLKYKQVSISLAFMFLWVYLVVVARIRDSTNPDSNLNANFVGEPGAFYKR